MKTKQPLEYYQQLPLITHEFYVPYFQHSRRVRVLLPQNYQHENQRYPVIYMHDGQNVFHSKEAYTGHSWKVIHTIKRNPQFPKVIIVGIDNPNHHIARLNEYSPWQTDTAHAGSAEYQSGGLGAAYGQWLVETVKPFVDTHYRTQPEREHTFVAGSSMGGLITAYLGAAYPQVFGGLGVFSLASWFSESAFLAFMQQHPLNPASKVYIQVGTKEGDEVDKHFIDNINQEYIDCSLRYYQTLLQTGTPLANINLRIMANKNHHESHWAFHFVEFLAFMLLPK